MFTLHTILPLKKTTLSRVCGGAYRAHDLGKLMSPAGVYLEWEGGLHVDLPGGISRSGKVIHHPT